MVIFLAKHELFHGNIKPSSIVLHEINGNNNPKNIKDLPYTKNKKKRE